MWNVKNLNQAANHHICHVLRPRFWIYNMYNTVTWRKHDESLIHFFQSTAYASGYDENLSNKNLSFSVYNVYAPTWSMLPSSDLLETYNKHTFHEMLGSCFHVKRSNSMLPMPFEVFLVSASWLHAYQSDLLHWWHKRNPCGYDVSRTIFMLIGQWSRSHG